MTSFKNNPMASDYFNIRLYFIACDFIIISKL